MNSHINTALSIGFVIFMLATPLALTAQWSMGLFPSLFALGFFFTFFSIIFSKQINPALKGVLLITISVLLELFYLNWIEILNKIFFNDFILTEAMKQAANPLNKIFLIACAGAGGSIIASYSDRLTQPSSATPLSDEKIILEGEFKTLGKSIKDLSSSFNEFKSNLKYICAFIFISNVILIIIILL